MQENTLEEKIIQNKKNGLPVLLGIALMYALSIFGLILCGIILDYLSGSLLKIPFTLLLIVGTSSPPGERMTTLK